MADVWIVDDSPMDLERARRTLSGSRIETFSDGSSALERLAEGARPDVIVLDWVMPGVSGIEVCRYLRENHPGRCGILLLTAQHRTEQIVEGLAAGADDYLAKPWQDEELRARVNALIRTREMVERTLRAESTVRLLLADIPDPLFMCDPEGRITFLNAEAERLTGATAPEVEGRLLTDVLPGIESFARKPLGVVALADLKIGDQIYAPTANHSAETTIVALRNMTQRRRMEERRLDLYSIVAHDLRSPLNATLMRTELMRSGRRGVLSAELLNDVSRIENSIRSLSAMVSDFLDLARLETYDYSLKRERIEVEPVIDATLEDLHPLAETSRLRLLREVEPGLVVNADPRRLAQVVNNLVGNAIKFTPPGGEIRIRAAVRAGTAEVRVEDNGSGIREDALPHIFRRYTRAVDTQEKIVGSGLGLMIVREIIESHGGTVGVDSTVGKGSSFWFRLPLSIDLPATKSATVGERLIRPGT